MAKNTRDKQISVRFPHAGERFRGRSAELKALRDAFLEKGSRAVGIYGPHAVGKSSLAVKFALSMPEEFDYVYSFDCRGGITAEEVLFRLCQFLDYHGLGSFQNIILSPIPMNLKVEFIAKVLNSINMLLIFDDMDTMLRPEHGQISVADSRMREFLAELVKLCEKGTRFVFTSTYSFDLPLDHIDHLEVKAPEEGAYITESSIRAAYENLSDGARKAINHMAAFEKSVPLKDMTEGGDELAGELAASELVGTFTLGGDLMGSVNSLGREHIRALMSKSGWREALLEAAEYRKGYALEHGVLWHSIYAHELYVEALRYDKAAEIAEQVTPTLLAWGQTALAHGLNATTAEFAEGRQKAYALYTMGLIELGRSEYDDSLAHLSQSKELYKSLDDMAGYSSTLIQIATIHNNRMKADEAMSLYEEALKIKEGIDDKDSVALILSRLGQIYQDRSEMDKAAEIFRRSADMAAEGGNSTTRTMALEKLGGIYSSQGNMESAIDAYERELELLVEGRDPNALTRAYNRLGGLYFRKGDPDKSIDMLKKSLKYSEVSRDKELAAINMLEMGRVYAETGQYKPAISNTSIALALFDALSSESKGAAIELLAHIEREMGPEEFEKINNQVMQEFRDKGIG